MIDIHTHVLPGIDDGSRDLRTSMRMLMMAYKYGTRRVIATPHFRGDRYTATPDQIYRLTEQLNENRPTVGLQDLKVYPGNEILYDSRTSRYLREGRVLGLADTTYALIEFMPYVAEEEVRRAVMDIRMSGFRPVIAHVERYDQLEMDPDILYDLREQGARIQINASSLEGKVKRRILRTMKEGLIDFVASDGHGLEHRPMILGQNRRYIEKKLGTEAARNLYCCNAGEILAESPYR